MTSTSFNVGLNSATRNSSKVLKPPGGGSSDIFGTTAEPAEPQRKVRNHLTSSIFTGETVTPSKNKADVNTGTGNSAHAVNGAQSFSNSVASDPAPAPAPATAPAPAPASAPAPAPSAGKQRVPPGGFSSGLW